MSIFRNCLFTLAALAIFASTAMAGEVWKITSLDWPPYSDPTMSSQGKSIQKLRDLLKMEGIDLVVEFYPWSRAREIARHKDYVGYFPAWPKEVDKGFTASLPVDWSEIGVMTYLHSGVNWTSLERLFDHKVGLVSTYDYPESITKWANTSPQKVEFPPNEVSLLKMLSAQRITVAITDPTVMNYLAEKKGVHNIRTVKILDKIPLVLSVEDSPENLRRIELLNRLILQ